MKIRKDDTVKVMSGKDRGKTGRVLRTDPKHGRVYVEGMNVQKRHTKPRSLPDPQPARVSVQGINVQKPPPKPRPLRDTQRAQEIGGIIEAEGPIHVSNVMLVDPKTGDTTRVGVKRDGGRRVRVAKKSGTEIDG